MTVNEELIRELAKVISDPGSVLPRAAIGPYRGEYETVPTWTARAVLVSLPRLGATVDTALPPAEEAVKRVEALVDELWPDDDDLHPALRHGTYRARFLRVLAEPQTSDARCRCGLPKNAPVHGNPFGAGHAYETALASPAPAPQGEEPTCYCGRLGHRLGGPILHKRTEECPGDR